MRFLHSYLAYHRVVLLEAVHDKATYYQQSKKPIQVRLQFSQLMKKIKPSTGIPVFFIDGRTADVEAKKILHP